MLKKLLIISSVLLLIVIIVLGTYNFIAKPNASSSNNIKEENPIEPDIKETDNDSDDNGEENISSEKIFEFSSEPVLGATLTYDKNAVKYYHRDMGNVYQMLLDGSSQKTVSATVLKDLIEVRWSPNKDQVITIYKDITYPHQKKFVFFDYNTKEAAVLHKNISDVVWLPSATQIAYHYFDPETNTGNIAISLPDGTNWKKIIDLNMRDIVLSEIPSQSKVSFYLKPTAYRESSLQTVSTLGGNPTTILSDQFGLGAKWSPGGTKALVSVTKERASSNIALGIVDIMDNYTFTELNIPTTLDKVAWSGDGEFIYYALPEVIPDEAVIPDDYIAKNIRTADTFWKMEIKSKKKEQITFKDDSDIIYDASGLFLSFKEDQIFFTNRDNGKLYYVKL